MMTRLSILLALAIASAAILQGCTVRTIYEMHRCGGSNICR